MRFFLFYFFSLNVLSARDICKFSVEICNIYQEIIQLNLAEAHRQIQEIPDKKSNFAIILIEDYIDFYQLFIYEEESDYIKFESNKKRRLKQIKNSKLDEEWSLFLQGKILLHWSLIHLKRNENWKAYSCVQEALQTLELCKSKYPSFIYSKKSLGILHTLIGTIPEEFEWAVRLLGFSGNIQNGKRELEEYIIYATEKKDIFKLESIAAYSFIESYIENKPIQGLQYWQKGFVGNTKSPLSTMILTKLMIRAAENRNALIEINRLTIEEKKPTSVFVFCFWTIKTTGFRSTMRSRFF